MVIYIFILLTPLKEGFSQGGLLYFKDNFKDSWGNSRKAEEIKIEIKILDGLGGNILLERQVIRTDENGFGVCLIGKGTDRIEQFEEVIWERGEYYLQIIQMDNQLISEWRILGVKFSQYHLLKPTNFMEPSSLVKGDESGILYWGRQQARFLGISSNGAVLSLESEGMGNWLPFNSRLNSSRSIINSTGSNIQFTTTAVTVSAPAVTTNPVTSITGQSAIGGGNVTNAGSSALTERGIVWSTSPNPSLTSSTSVYSKSSTNGIGSFTINMTGLRNSTIYYVRSYAKNSSGTSYGLQVQFTTTAVTLSAPTVTTNPVTSITGQSATGGGNVTNAGSSALTERGIVWSTSPNPSLTSSTSVYSKSSTNGIGSFTINMTGLRNSTIYYVRSYAKNSAGTSYGSQVQFTTSLHNYKPTVQINCATGNTNKTSNSITLVGCIPYEGTTPVTRHGFVWSENVYSLNDPNNMLKINPTIFFNGGVIGRPYGAFYGKIEYLKPKTKYWYRAYAINSIGTTFSDANFFITN